MKIMFIDTETTGVDHNFNALIQVAGILYDRTDDALQELERFNFKIRPFASDIIESKALEVNNMTMDEILEFPPPEEVYPKLVNIFNKYVEKYNRKDKFIFAGYNAQFDYNFLRRFLKKNNDNYFGSYFHFPPLDIMNLLCFFLHERRNELNNFKLKTVCEYLNLSPPEGKWHDAMTDIEMTLQLYLFLGYHMLPKNYLVKD